MMRAACGTPASLSGCVFRHSAWAMLKALRSISLSAPVSS
jgi:hypothetical protein